LGRRIQATILAWSATVNMYSNNDRATPVMMAAVSSATTPTTTVTTAVHKWGTDTQRALAR
jgi:hypothetical protein